MRTVIQNSIVRGQQKMVRFLSAKSACEPGITYETWRHRWKRFFFCTWFLLRSAVRVHMLKWRYQYGWNNSCEITLVVGSWTLCTCLQSVSGRINLQKNSLNMRWIEAKAIADAWWRSWLKFMMSLEYRKWICMIISIKII